MDLKAFSIPCVCIVLLLCTPIQPTVAPLLSCQEQVRQMEIQIDMSVVEDSLDTLTDFPNRYFNSEDGARASNWLLHEVSRLAQQAGTAVTVHVESVKGPWAQASVLAVIAPQASRSGTGGVTNGTNGTRRSKRATDYADSVILMAHLDTDGNDEWNRPPENSPGANDGASAVVVLLEIFRVLVEGEYVPVRPLQFHWYSAQNDAERKHSFLGSDLVAGWFSGNGTSVRVALCFDMVGWPGAASNATALHPVPVIVLQASASRPAEAVAAGAGALNSSGNVSRPAEAVAAGAAARNSSGRENVSASEQFTEFAARLVRDHLQTPVVFEDLGAFSDFEPWKARGYPTVFAFESAQPYPYADLPTDTVDKLDMGHVRRFVRLGLSFMLEASADGRECGMLPLEAARRESRHHHNQHNHHSQETSGQEVQVERPTETSEPSQHQNGHQHQHEPAGQGLQDGLTTPPTATSDPASHSHGHGINAAKPVEQPDLNEPTDAPDPAEVNGSNLIAQGHHPQRTSTPTEPTDGPETYEPTDPLDPLEPGETREFLTKETLETLETTDTSRNVLVTDAPGQNIINQGTNGSQPGYNQPHKLLACLLALLFPTLYFTIGFVWNRIMYYPSKQGVELLPNYELWVSVGAFCKWTVHYIGAKLGIVYSPDYYPITSCCNRHHIPIPSDPEFELGPTLRASREIGDPSGYSPTRSYASSPSFTFSAEGGYQSGV